MVFGKGTAFAASVDLSALDGTNGFRLDGIDAGDYSAFSVAGAGDVNSDGFDDLIVGAIGADPGGDSFAGETYVVFGKGTAFGASLDLAAVDGTNGFRLDGIDALDKFGVSVASAGDVNADGFDDLIVGAPYADPGGDSEAGESYVLFGRDFRNEAARIGTGGGDALTGTAANEILVGGLGDDSLDGAGGNDALDGGADADRLLGGEGADTLDGGAGNDTLTGEGDNDIFVFNDAPGGADADRIMDFGGAGATTMDAIHLENDVFTALVATGALAAGSFVSGLGPSAADPDDYILYDTGTGDLFYDADGSAAGAAVKFATIATAPAALAASDFVVV